MDSPPPQRMIETSEPELLNSLEPFWFQEIFVKNPPVGFKTGRSAHSYYFLIHFDLLTTLEPRIKRWLKPISWMLPKPLTVFFGATNSEYLCLKDDPIGIVEDAFALASLNQTSAIILKDLPLHSPLLSQRENDHAEKLIGELRCRGFQMVKGEALFFVPIDFATIEDYLARFRSLERSKMRRRLKWRNKVCVQEINLRDFKVSEPFVDQIFNLYNQVYEQSQIQFDYLTKDFFRDILTKPQTDAFLHLYQVDNETLAFTYSLIFRDNLVYKYVGFDYSRSRDFNLYFVCWFHLLERTAQLGLKNMIVGWTDPEIKLRLGAEMTLTYHAIFLNNWILRWALRIFRPFFEADAQVIGRMKSRLFKVKNSNNLII